MYWYLNRKGISWESWRRERYLRIFGVRTRVTRLLRDGSGFQVISCRRRFVYQSGLQNKPRKIIISPFYNTNFTPKSAGTHSDNMIFAKWSFNLLIKKKTKLVNSVDSCGLWYGDLVQFWDVDSFAFDKFRHTLDVHLNSLLRCLLVIFMYFASFYKREKHSRKIVNF